MGKLESIFKRELKNELKERYPGSLVTNLDPNDIQGIPDILILYNNKWATLEGKRNKKSTLRPNQQYYIDVMNKMSYSNIIYPENKEEVLKELDNILNSDN